MKIRKVIFNNKLLLFLCFLLSYLGSTYSFVKAIENKNDSISLTQKYVEDSNQTIKSEYLLDTGDALEINFDGIPTFNDIYVINTEGELLLPEIENIYVRNLTIKELKIKLAKKYEEFIFDPDLKIRIINYRPVKFYIYGESNFPGLYSMKYSESAMLNKEIKTMVLPPKLFDALKQAGGVSNNADLSKIRVIRKNSKTNGGGKIQAEINLLELILMGDQSQNIRIFDGDSIFIPKANQLIKDQIIAISKTNLSPSNITVYVTGNVNDPGSISLKKGSSLTQAILSSGGKKLLTGNIEFLRFKEGGGAEKKKFKFNKNAAANSYSNPILMEGDIIYVNKGFVGNTTELLKDISNPILSGFGLINLF